MHGKAYPIVVQQNSLLHPRKVIDKWKPPDYFVHPGDGHNIQRKNRLHHYQKITNHFQEHP